MFWEIIWKAVLIYTLVAYTVLFLATSIGGVKNISDMLRELKESHEKDEKHT